VRQLSTADNGNDGSVLVDFLNVKDAGPSSAPMDGILLTANPPKTAV
jgi:hypothetical protein